MKFQPKISQVGTDQNSQIFQLKSQKLNIKASPIVSALLQIRVRRQPKTTIWIRLEHLLEHHFRRFFKFKISVNFFESKITFFLKKITFRL